MLLYASNRRLEGWGSLDVGGPVELVIWRSVSSLETAPMWVSPTHGIIQSLHALCYVHKTRMSIYIHEHLLFSFSPSPLAPLAPLLDPLQLTWNPP